MLQLQMNNGRETRCFLTLPFLLVSLLTFCAVLCEWRKYQSAGQLASRFYWALIDNVQEQGKRGNEKE